MVDTSNKFIFKFKNIIKNDYIIVLLLFFISIISKIFFLTDRNIYGDEPFTIFKAQESISDIINIVKNGEPNPPLFMILVHMWIKLFGLSTFNLRILPLLFNSLTVIFIYLFGSKYIKNKFVGIIAALIFLLSMRHFFFATEVRTYSLMSLCAAASLYYYFMLSTEPKNKIYFIGLFIFNLILIYCHYFSVFILINQFIFLIFFIKNINFIKIIFLNYIFLVISYIPMLKIIYEQFIISKKVTWLLPPETRFYKLFIDYLLNDKIITLISIIIFLLSIAILIYLFFFKKNKYALQNVSLKKYFIIFLWFIIPYTLMFFISYKVSMFLDRYILFNSIALYISIALSLGVLFLIYKPLGIGISILFLLLFSCYLHPFSKDYTYREVKKAVEYVSANMNDSTIAIIYPQWEYFGFTYYYDQNIFKSLSEAEAESKLHSKNIYFIWGLENLHRVLQDKSAMKNSNNILLYVSNGNSDNGSIIYRIEKEGALTETKSFVGYSCYKFHCKIKSAPQSIQDHKIDEIIFSIKQDVNWMKLITKKANVKNISVDSMLYIDAKDILDHQKNK
jgi:hypothetical protein